MTDLFLKIVNRSISATWLVLAVALLRLLLKKAPKWMNVLLWGMVAVRLICPFTLESGFSLIPEQVSSGKAVSEWADDYVGDTEVFFENQEEFQTAVNAGRTPLYAGEDGYYVVTAPDGVSTPRTVENTVAPLLSVLWCVGMAAMGEYALFSYWGLRRRVRMAIHVTDNIYLSEFVDTPFVLGLLRPRIYLPYHMSEQDSHHVIAHERTHIKRKDHWWKPLGFGLLAVHWFNPAMWVAYILLCRDIELACDEKVVKELGMEQRADYSQALLNCSVHHKQIAACPLAFGEVGVKERVKNVLRYQKPASWVILIAVTLCIVVAVCFLTDPWQPDSLEWMQTLNPETVEYIEYINEKEVLDRQYTLYTGDKLIEAITYLHNFNGTAVRNDAILPVESSGYQLNISTISGNHTVINVGDVYLVIDGDYYEDTDHILTQYFDTYFYGTTYLPATENQELNVSLVVEDVSPTGITVHFENYDSRGDLVLYSGNNYFLQEQVNGVWTNLPTLRNAVFTTESYSFSSIRRHRIDWEWLYGILPVGHYRIGKNVSVHSPDSVSDQSQVIFAEFDISGHEKEGEQADAWMQAVVLDVESASPTGATVSLQVQEDALLPGRKLMSGSDYCIQRKVDGNWTDVETLTEAVFTTEAYEITNVRRHRINWEWLYGTLPAGEYRIGKGVTLWKNAVDSDYGTIYAEFTIVDSPIPPYYVTSTLSTEDLSASAEFIANGGGYNFFEDMEVQLVKILRGLDEDDFTHSQGIDQPHTIITLTAGDTMLTLRSDEKQVEIVIDGDTSGTRWVVTSEALNRFFAEMNQYSQANSTYEIYNVAPLNELPAHYSMEEASIDKVVITENGLVLHNSEVWAEFWDDTQHHIPATVRCMNVSEGGSDIYDIEFDGEEYHYRIMRDGELWDISYRYLKFFNGDAPENAEYDAFEYFVLVNDANVTWEQIQRSYISSQSADEVDHRIVHRHHIYYPKQPNIPTVVQAELVAAGETLALVTNEETVHEILHLINGAEWLGFEPATYFFGPRLMLLGEDGRAYSLDLDVTDDLCRFGDKFYDYGPGMDGEASINNLPKLLALFGLEDWPESVKELFPYLFG